MGQLQIKGPQKFVKAPIPLPPSVVNDVVVSNQNHEDIYIIVQNTHEREFGDILNYLSYSKVKFRISSDKKTLRDMLVKSDLWFNQNNVINEHFSNAPNRFDKLLDRYFNPDLDTLEKTGDDLEDFSLAELSVLEFGDLVYSHVCDNKLKVDIDMQQRALKLSHKRSLCFQALQSNHSRRGDILEILPKLQNEDVILFKYKDTLKKNIESSSRPLGQSKYNTVNLHLEVLNSCSYACAGCYVKRKNELPSNWAEQLNSQLSDSKFTEWNEVVVGPTDIFSASNFNEIFDMQESWMSDVLSRFSAITFNSTLCMSDDEILNKFQKLKSVFPNKQLEFFIIVDINHFLTEDPKYMSWLKRKVDLLEDSNIIFTINTPSFFFWRFEAPGEIAFRHFGKNFKYTPSFFRSNNKKIIKDHLKSWSKNCIGHTNILNYTYDKYFGGETYTTFVYKAGNLFWSPCVIDFVFVDDKKFKLKHSEDVRELRLEKPQGDCVDCPEKTNCQARGVLAVKNYLGSNKCILPDDFTSIKHSA